MRRRHEAQRRQAEHQTAAGSGFASRPTTGAFVGSVRLAGPAGTSARADRRRAHLPGALGRDRGALGGARRPHRDPQGRDPLRGPAGERARARRRRGGGLSRGRLAHRVSRAPAARRREEILDGMQRLRAGGNARSWVWPPAPARPTVRDAFVVARAAASTRTLAPGRRPDLRDQLQQIFIRVNDAYQSLSGRASGERLAEAVPPKPTRNAPEPAAPPAKAAARPFAEFRRSLRRPWTRRRSTLRVAEALRAAAELYRRGRDAGGGGGAARGAQPGQRSSSATASASSSRAPMSRSRAGAATGSGLLSEMLRESPDDAEALAILGALYHREGLLARAEATLRRALGFRPRPPGGPKHLRAVSTALQKRRTPVAAPTPGRPGPRGPAALYRTVGGKPCTRRSHDSGSAAE